jgi:hypothetical protein
MIYFFKKSRILFNFLYQPNTISLFFMRNAWLYTLIPLLSHLCLLGPIILLKKMGPTTLSPLSLILLVQVDKSEIKVEWDCRIKHFSFFIAFSLVINGDYRQDTYWISWKFSLSDSLLCFSLQLHFLFILFFLLPLFESTSSLWLSLHLRFYIFFFSFLLPFLVATQELLYTFFSLFCRNTRATPSQFTRFTMVHQPSTVLHHEQSIVTVHDIMILFCSSLGPGVRPHH